MTTAIDPQVFNADEQAPFAKGAVLAKLARVSFSSSYLFGSLLLTATVAVLAWLVVASVGGSPLAPLAYAILLAGYYLALMIRSDIWRWMARRRINKARRELGLPEGDFGLLENLEIIES